MIQYIFMIGEDIGYTITAGISLRYVTRVLIQRQALIQTVITASEFDGAWLQYCQLLLSCRKLPMHPT